MRVIGYGICGPGEAGRYMRDTLEEFRRLCDKTIILLNGTYDDMEPERRLCKEYGISWVCDAREWGRQQHIIKQEFMDKKVRLVTREGDIMVGLDMDERFDRHLTKEWLLSMPFDAYHTYVVDLWNDEEHYKPESCFWKVQIWRWNGDVSWKQKPLHCGLAPLWAASHNRYAPFLMIHKGLMTKESRARKIARYEKYDPDQRYLGHQYYWMLKTDTAEPFDEEALHATIADEVATYKQTKPRTSPAMEQKKPRFAYVQNPAGMTVDIPEAHLDQTLKRKGFTFLGWADDAEEAMEELFQSDGAPAPARTGSYQRSQQDEQREVDALNGRDDQRLRAVQSYSDGCIPSTGPNDGHFMLPGCDLVDKPAPTVERSRLGMRESEAHRKTRKGRA